MIASRSILQMQLALSKLSKSKSVLCIFRTALITYFVWPRHGFERVVIVITSHSHDDTGDLYVGPNLCTTVDDVSTQSAHESGLDLIGPTVYADPISSRLGSIHSAQD
jgi:hypothetical protein